MVKINGSSFALQYKRTTGRPIDSTATFKTLEDATSYARNTDAEEYFPYPGQIISVEVDGGQLPNGQGLQLPGVGQEKGRHFLFRRPQGGIRPFDPVLP